MGLSIRCMIMLIGLGGISTSSITFPNLGKAYQLKEQFKEIYNNAEPADAVAALQEWIRLAEVLKLAPLQTFVNTLKAHWSGIVNYFI
jgi:transposase